MEVLQDQNQKKKNPRQIGNAYLGYLQQLRFSGIVPPRLPRMRLLPWQASDGNQYGEGLIWCRREASVHLELLFIIGGSMDGMPVMPLLAS